MTRDFPKISPKHVDLGAYPPGIAYMDGQYLPVSEAKIPVLDYGLLHSDATYDTVHVWDGAFFRLDDHLDRFAAGMEKLHLAIPYERAEVVEILHNCVALSGLRNAYVEFICTRGMSPTFSRDPRDAVNRFIAFAIPFGSVANPDQMARGLHAAITPIVRIPASSVDPTVKNYHWLDLIKGLYAAYDRGAETAILLDGNGNVAEGPGFNVFSVKDGAVSTPKEGVLMGLTRRSVLEICATLNVTCVTCDVGPDQLRQADEVFISSTAGGVMPVTRIDGAPVRTGKPGALTETIRAAYWRMHDDDTKRSVVVYPSEG
ncbi:MAG: aminotransferase class IV [Pseudomonadota bacterium]